MVTALVIMSCAVSLLAIRDFRHAGVQPFFYQSNFEPAVLLACGRGFGVLRPPSQVVDEFLLVKRESLECSALPGTAVVVPLTASAHANWYYMYGAAAAVWRITGVSWPALDWLVAAMAGIAAAALYGLFRLVAARTVSAAVALLLTLSPANLTALMSLRDYSKAPFVLSALLILAVLIVCPLGRRPTWMLAAAYGIVVGIGYGFRGDLIVMVPLGVFVVLLLLPGGLTPNIARNGLAAAALLAGFLAVGWPILNGLKFGGCQYHFSLLGLTSPLTTELRLTPSLYRFGDHLTDTFVDVNVGDYAWRMLDTPDPLLCSAAYDTASGQMYREMATTFPADFVARAYSSVLGILRVGLGIPPMVQPLPPFPSVPWIASIYRIVNRATGRLAPAGPLLALAAVALAWARSSRLGLALTLLMLFLTGYPAIQFEARHYFHLRFIPWWSGAMVVGALLHRGSWPRQAIARGAVAAAAVLVLLAGALMVIRVIQERSATALFAQYEAAPSEPVATGPPAGAFLPVLWEPRDHGSPAEMRSSDLLAVTLDAADCGGSGLLSLKVRYDADVPSHDLSNDIAMERPVPGPIPTRVFVPVFRKASATGTHLHFSGFEIAGATVDCIASVARVTDLARPSLWLQVALPAGWREHALHETLRPPRILNR